MTQYKIYHNPRCSKSRQTLALLEESAITPEVILYLETPPTEKELTELLGKLGISPRDLLRKGEAEYKALGLSDSHLTDPELIKAMCENPRLIERPIVVANDRAVLGRPPENVLELIG